MIGLDALAETDGRTRGRPRRASRRRVAGRTCCSCTPRSRRCPPSSTRVADEVYVQLPWGGLLEGIVLARDDVLGGLAALCRPGARVVVTLNGEIWLDSTPARYEQLPVPTPEYVAEVVAPGFAARRDRARRGALLDRGGSEGSCRRRGRAGSDTVASIRASFSSKASRRLMPAAAAAGRGAATIPPPARGAERDRAAVQLGDLLDDREAEARAGHGPRGRRPVEAVEHVREIVGGDARRRGRGPRRRRRARRPRPSCRRGLNFSALSTRLRDRALEQRDAAVDRSRARRSSSVIVAAACGAAGGSRRGRRARRGRSAAPAPRCGCRSRARRARSRDR